MRNILFFLASIVWFGKNLSAQNLSNYIAKYSPIAQEIMSETQIPASLILGVAIHESAYGKSKIARHLNNHFGIKGKNHSTKIRSSYKEYFTIEDSYRHFAQIVKSRAYFSQLLNRPAEEWVRRIHKGYAKNPAWALRVLAIIKLRNLKQLDSQLLNTIENHKIKKIKNPYIDTDLHQ